MLIRLCSGTDVGVSSPGGPHASDDIPSPDAKPDPLDLWNALEPFEPVRTIIDYSTVVRIRFCLLTTSQRFLTIVVAPLSNVPWSLRSSY
jgi:hypothetical protein